MTCPQCAFDNPPAMAFCGRCGTRLAAVCPSCGFVNPEGFAFAHCHLGLGKLYSRTGRRQEAQEHLDIATTMYREMDMRLWLEQAEAESRALA